MSTVAVSLNPSPSLRVRAATYLEFVRIGFVNILAFRLRYYTGILTYLINVGVYHFIWQALYAGANGPIAGFSLPEMLSYVNVGWILRSFYWNTIDQEMAYEVLEGKIAMDLIKPVSVQWMWLTRAMGESAFRLCLLTAPTAVAIWLLFSVRGPASAAHLALFALAALGSFLLMGAINFMAGTCAIPLTSILALIRAKFWLIEMLSGLVIPLSFFPPVLRKISAWLPFEHIAYTPLQIYLGKLSPAASLRLLAIQYAWIAILLFLGDRWWRRATRKITIHGG